LWTIFVSVLIAAVLWPTRGPGFALGFLGTAVWAVLGFLAIEHLVRQALLPRDKPRNALAIIGLIAAKIGLYGFGFWVLVSGVVPPMSCFFGFTLLLVVLMAVALIARPQITIQPEQRDQAPAVRGKDD
jgi:hypothetical protein